MKKYNLATPKGAVDLLFEECVIKRRLEKELSSLFEEKGYHEVITSAVENYEVFGSSGMYINEEEMLKLTDNNGKLLVLRPDSTSPIARLVATRLKNESLPIRLYYIQNVFRATSQMNGQSTEMWQAGVELLGASGKAADMEILSLSMEALKKLGMKDFRLEIGEIGFVSSLIRGICEDSVVLKEITELIEKKNYSALIDLADQLSNDRLAVFVRQLPSLFGGPEVFDNAQKLCRTFANNQAEQAVSYLKELYNELSSLGLSTHISIDLGMVNENEYYTGIVFRGYTSACGEAVLSGGRYDTLLSDFRRDMPAVGFAVNINPVIKAQLMASGDCNSETAKETGRPLRIALTKGRLEKDIMTLFERVGIDCSTLQNKGRKLVLPLSDNLEVVLAKAFDVITYVESGVCDIGVVGKDTIMESGKSFFEIMDLEFGKCRFCLAGPKDQNFFDGYHAKRIATKYPNVAKNYFESLDMNVDIVKIEGSVELAPILSLSDAIVDIVETGSTLKENGLDIISEIAPISARMIVNVASMKLRKTEIEAFVTKLKNCK